MAQNETARRAREHADADYGFGGIGYGECRNLLRKCADEIERIQSRLDKLTAAVDAAKESTNAD
jgi:hypothetical protein